MAYSDILDVDFNYKNITIIIETGGNKVWQTGKGFLRAIDRLASCI